MKLYRIYPKIWQTGSIFLVILMALSAFGCNGTRFIFKASEDIVSTPNEVGLAYEDVWFTTQDDIKLHAWLVPGEPNKPIVVFFHGNAANISHRVDILQYFNEMGFSVFIFDYRGFGKSNGQANSEENLYIDSRGALNYLKSRGWSASRMIYYGRSMGAAASLQMGLEFPPAVVVMEAPFTSMSEIAWHTAPITYALIGWWSIRARFDNINKIEKLTTPVVFIQGNKDHIVPVDMAQRLYERANEPKAFYLIPKGGHSNLYQIGGEKYREIWLKLARHHLPIR
ncbi:MAG: lysophospholipase [Deltaproteobacteria bacterium]|nr:lysophospholipase [Deltaproteobacteria bacterium]